MPPMLLLRKRTQIKYHWVVVAAPVAARRNRRTEAATKWEKIGTQPSVEERGSDTSANIEKCVRIKQLQDVKNKINTRAAWSVECSNFCKYTSIKMLVALLENTFPSRSTLFPLIPTHRLLSFNRSCTVSWSAGVSGCQFSYHSWRKKRLGNWKISEFSHLRGSRCSFNSQRHRFFINKNLALKSILLISVGLYISGSFTKNRYWCGTNEGKLMSERVWERVFWLRRPRIARLKRENTMSFPFSHFQPIFSAIPRHSCSRGSAPPSTRVRTPGMID